MTKKYKSKVLAAAHETALGMTEAGVMSKRTMRKFDEMCLAPVEDMPPERTRTARPVSKPLVTALAQQLGGGVTQPRHGRPKLFQVFQRNRFLGPDGGGQARHGFAAAGDDHLLTGLHLVEEFAETLLGLSQIDRNHEKPHMVMKLATS